MQLSKVKFYQQKRNLQNQVESQMIFQWKYKKHFLSWTMVVIGKREKMELNFYHLSYNLEESLVLAVNLENY